MRSIANSQLVTALLVSALAASSALTAGEAPKAPDGERGKSAMGIRITVTSVMVDDQEKALKFYTDKLGFVKKHDVPAGPARWLTVVAPDDPDGTELLLEPLGFPPARTFQKALFDAGIPWTSFGVADIQATYERLKQQGVVFRSEPTKMGPVTVAVLEDTCGNLIQLAQK